MDLEHDAQHLNADIAVLRNVLLGTGAGLQEESEYMEEDTTAPRNSTTASSAQESATPAGHLWDPHTALQLNRQLQTMLHSQLQSIDTALQRNQNLQVCDPNVDRTLHSVGVGPANDRTARKRLSSCCRQEADT